MKSSLSFGKVWFILSVMVLGIGYGLLANERGWFPSPQARKAFNQAKAVLGGLRDGILRPRVHDRTGVTVRKRREVQPGLTLITSWWNGANRVRLIDQTGEVVHEWKLNSSKLFPSHFGSVFGSKPTVLHGTYLFPNGDLLVNVEYIGTARVDACGNVRWRLAESTHHSIARSEDGSFWISDYGDLETPKTFPGLGKTSSLEKISRISEDGEVISQFNVMDILYKNNLEHYIARFDDKGVHLNDVEPLPTSLQNEYPLFKEGDLLVSLRDLNLVFVFDPNSEVVKWHTSRPFISQHDPDFIGDGWIGIFDNRKDFTDRGEMLGGSRIVAVQPHTDSTKVLFPTAQSEPFYTDVRGKWQMLENGNLLLSETQAGRVVEVNPEGQTVWEWIHEPYNNSRVPAVTKASRHDLTREEIASWPCSSVDSVSTSAQ